MSLVLLNLGILGALHPKSISLLRPRISISPASIMNSSAPRQRKKASHTVTSDSAKFRQMQQVLKDHQNASNRFVGAHVCKVMLLATIGLFIATYFFLLNSEEQMYRAVSSPSILRRRQHRTGLAAATSANHIIQARKPFLVYGTAWKEERTAEYVHQAVQAGFRFIDTACQPRHYNESGVGEGWSSAAHDLGLARDEFFLQTKYTPFGGQDPNNIPYNPDDPLEEQVRTSLAVSLKNLKTDYLDSWVLHSPLGTMEDTMKVWRTMESFVDAGKVRRLGISNSYAYEQFTTLYHEARIKPSVLQNRFHAETRFDTRLRHFCRDHNIWYQSFWTLTANRQALAHNEHIHEVAQEYGLTPQTAMFAFLLSTGYITPLSGTTSKHHMAEDVAIMERIQGGEVFFPTETDLREFSEALGMPDL